MSKRTIMKSLSLIALVAVLVPIGCGSSGDSTRSTATGDTGAAEPKSSHDPCEPRRAAGPVLDPPRRAPSGKPAAIEIGETKATLTVTGTSFPRTIDDHFGEQVPFEPSGGSALVAVTYELENAGPEPLEPSEDLNAKLLLRASGAQYPYAAELPCSIPITASWALEQGGSNPAQPLPAGGRARTAIVFIAPRQDPGTKISLVLPEQVGIPLGRTG
jgi:hypothetical protein